MAVLNRDKKNVSRRGKVNDRGKKRAYRHLKMTLNVGNDP